MTPEQLSERKAATLARFTSAAEALLPLKAAYPVNTPEHGAANNAEVQLRVAAHLVDELSSALAVYQDAAFYAELVPSLAKDDQGQHARDVLEYVFPE